jgi:hypothetical protein
MISQSGHERTHAVQQATRENQLPDPGSEARAGDSTHRVEGLSPEEQDRIASTLLLETVVIDVDGPDRGRRHDAAQIHQGSGSAIAVRSGLQGLYGRLRLCGLGRGPAQEGGRNERRKKLIDALVWQLD